MDGADRGTQSVRSGDLPRRRRARKRERGRLRAIRSDENGLGSRHRHRRYGRISQFGMTGVWGGKTACREAKQVVGVARREPPAAPKKPPTPPKSPRRFRLRVQPKNCKDRDEVAGVVGD